MSSNESELKNFLATMLYSLKVVSSLVRVRSKIPKLDQSSGTSFSNVISIFPRKKLMLMLMKRVSMTIGSLTSLLIDFRRTRPFE